MEYYHMETQRKPTFFRAKKLVVQEEKTRLFGIEQNQQRLNRQEWASGFYPQFVSGAGHTAPMNAGNPGCSLLDSLRTNEFNPNTALLYLKWADTNQNDIALLFTDQ